MRSLFNDLAVVEDEDLIRRSSGEAVNDYHRRGFSKSKLPKKGASMPYSKSVIANIGHDPESCFDL